MSSKKKTSSKRNKPSKKKTTTSKQPSKSKSKPKPKPKPTPKDKPARQKVEYQCNACSKVRMLFIPHIMVREVDSTGYVEYVDLHKCEPDLKANILFVDNSFDVRSQVPVESSTIREKKPIAPSIPGLDIPSPKKAELISQEIHSRMFTPFNLFEMKIEDKLRQVIYNIVDMPGEVVSSDIQKVKKKTLSYISRLGFIKIEPTISEKLDEEIVETWFKQLANVMESIVLIDEEMLNLIAAYIDTHLTKEPEMKELLEIDLLLHSTIILPNTTERTVNLYTKDWRDIFPDLPLLTHRIYKGIMQYSQENKDKTLLHTYELVHENAREDVSYAAYLAAISDLIMKGLLTIEKMQFFTTADPKLQQDEI